MTVTSRQFSANFATPFASTFYFSQPHMPSPQKIKRACNPPHGFSDDNMHNMTVLCINSGRRASANKGFKEIGGSVVNCNFVPRISSCDSLTVLCFEIPNFLNPQNVSSNASRPQKDNIYLNRQHFDYLCFD
jgi:hypothetical protein